MLGKDFTTDICLWVCAVPAQTEVHTSVEVRGQPQMLVVRQCHPFVRVRVSHWLEASPIRLG